MAKPNELKDQDRYTDSFINTSLWALLEVLPVRSVERL